jgi:Bifunctional DNA primase/polymerase, N-terminal
MTRLLEPDERLRAALRYAAHGLHVLPLQHPVSTGAALGVGCSCAEPACDRVGDHPLSPGGAADATTDPARIRWWWRRFPLANVGLATGIAFDVLEVEAAAADLLRWSLVVAALRAGGPLVRTGGDGWQFLLAPLGLGSLEPGGLDRVTWRGFGDWIAAPPSRHASGAVAAWVHDPETALPVPEAPWPLRQRLPALAMDRPPLRSPSPVRPFVRLRRAVAAPERSIHHPPVATANGARTPGSRD